MDRKKATKRIGKMQRCVPLMGPWLTDFIKRPRKLADWDSEDEFGPTPAMKDVFEPGEQESSSRRSEIHTHPGGVGRMSFVALGPQIGRERGVRDSEGCHERCVLRCEWAL